MSGTPETDNLARGNHVVPTEWAEQLERERDKARAQINIAIAEACGWRIAERVSPEAKEDATACWIRPNGDEWQEESLPDYCNDLNAMHEAEKTLSYKQKKTYCEKLFNLPTIELESNTFATARQRAEAFLKTIGKWEGGK